MSMSMQMISDKMHFDTMILWKVDGYNILSVYSFVVFLLLCIISVMNHNRT